MDWSVGSQDSWASFMALGDLIPTLSGQRAATSPKQDVISGTRSSLLVGHHAPRFPHGPRVKVLSIMTNSSDVYSVSHVPSTGRASTTTL